jgi:hypothetical protein
VSDESDPPRKFYGLKPKEFETVNPPASSAPVDSLPTSVQDHIREANRVVVPATPSTPTAPRDNDVQAMLRDNLARANAAGLNDLQPKVKRPSKRKRDYWLLFTTVNAVLAYVAFRPGAGIVELAYGVAGMLLFTITLTWTMWFILDDY